MNALEMNPEIRAKWVAALRSGKYKQGRKALRDGDTFCCLGVLCDLAVRAGVAGATAPDSDAGGELGGWWSYDGRVDYLPESVMDWAGLATPNPNSGDEFLAEYNDSGWSFARIADAIDGIAAEAVTA
jgi:hypothetical protein